MVILGIDPGYAIVGWGVVEYSHSKFRVLGYGAITTEATAPFPERLQIIYNDMCYLFDKYKPEAMSMEKLFYNSNQKRLLMLRRQGESSLSPLKCTARIFLNTLRFRLNSP